MKVRTTAKFALPVLAAGGLAAGVVPAGAATHLKPQAGFSVTSINNSFSALAALAPIAAKGKGGITAILPDEVSSARYVEFDAPDLEKALLTAGVPAANITVENALGSDATQLNDAKAAIAKGSKVLLVDPLDSGVGKAIESYAAANGAKVIDYDRLTLGGSRQYYVSFNNVYVGTLLGKGLVSCVAGWHVSKPNVLVMHGATTDNNATLFAQGYDAVLQSYFSSGKWTLAGRPAGTWTPTVAQQEFEAAFSKDTSLNAALVPNDENAAPIITYLQDQHVKAHSFPITGQDATLVGLQNILTGYQCGTVYKPIYLEAGAAAALAVYLNAGMKPPSGLVNGMTTDTTANKSVPSVLLTPEWVTTKNMKKTVVADGVVTTASLCAGKYAMSCHAAGI
jgi:D-xylose transport system substrate-binding protein